MQHNINKIYELIDEKIKDNIQDEDTSLWNDVKYPMLIYCIVIIVINI